MLKDCKLIIISHYDFTDKETQKNVKGSKLIVSYDNKTLTISSSDDTIFQLPLLTNYTCDLVVNEKMKIDIANVRK